MLIFILNKYLLRKMYRFFHAKLKNYPADTLELSETGGHAGFITGAIPGKPIYWLDNRIPDFLVSQLSN
jgi:predicted alpha/beta-fold hydrolase